MLTLRRLTSLFIVCFILMGCSPPPVQYTDKPFVQERRTTLKTHLIALLPKEQQKDPAAWQEAQWLADTAYKAAAGISRVNNSSFPGWFGNALVNGRWQDRGLCWHYQHDMYRELRRRPLQYFRIGCCVRDKSEASEHNCVYIAATDGAWPEVWVLDAWKYNGRLRISYGPQMNQKRWADLPGVTDQLGLLYTEGHQYPIEHWFMVRKTNGKYNFSNASDVRQSPQYRRMHENIKKGYREHPGSLTNY